MNAIKNNKPPTTSPINNATVEVLKDPAGVTARGACRSALVGCPVGFDVGFVGLLVGMFVGCRDGNDVGWLDGLHASKLLRAIPLDPTQHV